MVKIIKDGETILCSKSTYESMYKRLGYEIEKPNEVVKPKVEVSKKETIEEVEEIPVVEVEVPKTSKRNKK